MYKTRMSRKNYELMLERGFVDLNKYRYSVQALNPNSNALNLSSNRSPSLNGYSPLKAQAIPLLSVAMGSSEGSFECRLTLY